MAKSGEKRRVEGTPGEFVAIMRSCGLLMTTIWRTRDFPSTAGKERSPRTIELEFKRISQSLFYSWGEELLFNIQSCSILMCCQDWRPGKETGRRRKVR
jgi:hypothetical protein